MEEFKLENKWFVICDTKKQFKKMAKYLRVDKKDCKKGRGFYYRNDLGLSVIFCDNEDDDFNANDFHRYSYEEFKKNVMKPNLLEKPLTLHYFVKGFDSDFLTEKFWDGTHTPRMWKQPEIYVYPAGQDARTFSITGGTDEPINRAFVFSYIRILASGGECVIIAPTEEDAAIQLDKTIPSLVHYTCNGSYPILT